MYFLLVTNDITDYNYILIYVKRKMLHDNSASTENNIHSSAIKNKVLCICKRALPSRKLSITFIVMIDCHKSTAKNKRRQTLRQNNKLIEYWLKGESKVKSTVLCLYTH